MSNRQDYERKVRAVAEVAETLVSSGVGAEAVAREVVGLRNAMKVDARALDDPDLVRLMETRNIMKYGNAIGPDADQLFVKYGSWERVIAAACRHAKFGGA